MAVTDKNKPAPTSTAESGILDQQDRPLPAATDEAASVGNKEDEDPDSFTTGPDYPY